MTGKEFKEAALIVVSILRDSLDLGEFDCLGNEQIVDIAYEEFMNASDPKEDEE